MPSIHLPIQSKIPKDNPGDMCWLIFGPDKVGKTALCAEFPKHFILECNPGNADHTSRNSVDIHSLGEFLSYIELLSKKPDYCQTLIIDEIARLYYHLYVWARNRLNIPETEQNSYALWRLTGDKFSELLNEIKKLPFGKIFTANVEEIQTATIAKLDTNCTNQAREKLHGVFNFRGYMDRETSGERYLQLDGSTSIVLGNSLSNHFNFNGNRLKRFSLGFSPKEAYQNFIKAFNNAMPGEVVQGPPKPKMVIKK